MAPLPRVRDGPALVRALLIAAALHSLTVPLDHTGATPGTLKLAYTRVPATGTRTGTLVFLAGGPGQEAIPFTGLFSRLMQGARRHDDIVFIDQRGTGRSEALPCAFARLAECGERLGARRPFLTTTETAADLEDLRVRLGVDKLTPIGISYGSEVAEAYARRFPAHTAAVILDSPVLTPQPDALDRASIAAIPRVLADVCTSVCRRTVGNVGAVYRRALARVRGHQREDVVYDALRSMDTQPVLRAELPAALASLAHGDTAPLLHASALWPEEASLGGINYARMYATECVEEPLPWAPDSPVESRDADVVGSDAFAPFSTHAALPYTAIAGCEDWPPTPRPAPLPAAVPDVPVLVISGRDDIRTPLEDARRVAAAYPHATLLEIPHTGHSDLRTDIWDARSGAPSPFSRPGRCRVARRHGRWSRPRPTCPRTCTAAARSTRPWRRRGATARLGGASTGSRAAGVSRRCAAASS